jgi:hypothetical protein
VYSAASGASVAVKHRAVNASSSLKTILYISYENEVFKYQAVSKSTHHNATHSSCNIGKYENASCGKCVMLLSERSLKKKNLVKYLRTRMKRKQLTTLKTEPHAASSKRK